MNNFKLSSLLVLSLCFVFASCDPEDISSPSAGREGRDYVLYVGTILPSYLSASGQEVRANPTGSVSIRKASGGVELLKKKLVMVNATISTTYDSTAGKYQKTFDMTPDFTTNNDGDFYIRQTVTSGKHGIDQRDRLVEINKMSVVLTSFVDGVTYQKVYEFSNKSIWDKISGLKNVFIDLKLSELAQEDRNSVISRYLDIDGDIILEPITAPVAKKKAARVDDSGRMIIKDAPSVPQSGGSKSSKGNKQ